MAVKLSKEEFLWREWRLGEGRYKGRGPKSKPRPLELRPIIPMVWYARLVAFLKRRKPVPITPPAPSLGIWERRMAMYRQPRGGNESFAVARDEGKVGIALFNIGDHTPEEWAGHGSRCDALGIEYGYWKHLHTVADLDGLLAVSRARGRKVVGLNVEAELLDVLNPVVIADRVKRSGYIGDWCTIALGWVQNGVDLTPIGHKPIYLEIFPADAPALWPPKEKTLHCLSHAQVQNAKFPIPMYQCYRGGQPDWFDLTILNSLYTVDDMQERWDIWTDG